MNIIDERKILEGKATKRAIYFGYGSKLDTKNGRVLSCSPASYYYVTGINYDNYEADKFRKLSEKIHNDDSLERTKLEKKLIPMMKNIWLNNRSSIFSPYEVRFFQWKNEFMLNYNELEGNKLLLQRVYKLLKKWENLSQNEHYTLNNAEKRLIKKGEK